MSQTHTWDVNIQTGGEICQWIIDQGGWTELTTADVLYAVDVRLGYQTPGWDVTTQQVLGIIDYRLDNVAQGNSNTGCVFT